MDGLNVILNKVGNMFKDLAKQIGKMLIKSPYFWGVMAVVFIIIIIVGTFMETEAEGVDNTEDMISQEMDYIVKTDVSNSSPVITDIDELKKAFGGYATNSKLLAEAQTFLDMQQKYKVNAIFAAAVAITETTAGTNGNVALEAHNWFNYQKGGNVENLDGYLGVTEDNWVKWDTDAHGIMGFGSYISEHSTHYFSQGYYSVSEIGNDSYCVPPENWIKKVKSFMYDMYNAAELGIDVSGVPGKTGTVKVQGTEVPTYTASNGKTYIMYNQTKGPWASEIYVDGQTIAQCGCPTTACATVATGLGISSTPTDFKNFYTQGVEVLKNKGLTANRTTISNVQKNVDVNHKNKIIGYLQQGHPVIFHTYGSEKGGESIFTSQEHWMALLDINAQATKVYVASGASRSANGWYDIDTALVSLKDYVDVYK